MTGTTETDKTAEPPNFEVPKFGTSGLRGLVTGLTQDLVAAYTGAFVRACTMGTGVYVGHDLRASSPQIAQWVMDAAAAGVDVTDLGAVPTPALALAALDAGGAAVMVTGSHIPADRNGLKFYTPKGEITKADEAAILAEFALAKIELAKIGAAKVGAAKVGAEDAPKPQRPSGQITRDGSAAGRYIARYVDAFGPRALAGLRIGIYQHSSVARDIMALLARALGAEAVPLARADTFIPVDTEAVDASTRAQLSAWAQTHALDAIWSTDGDADRPMLAIGGFAISAGADGTGADGTGGDGAADGGGGRVIAGDVLGVLTARALGADVVCTPVSSNSMIEAMGVFTHVARCKIGSPFVIAAMEGVLAQNPAAKVVGFEANGGFLLGFAAGVDMGADMGANPDPDASASPLSASPLSASPLGARPLIGSLPALMTRDAALPLIAPLALAHARGQSLADLLAALPARITAADRLQNTPPAASAALMARLQHPALRTAFVRAAVPALLGIPAREIGFDTTDGLRMAISGGRILHLRPSGNAPELRIYVEAADEAAASALLAAALAHTRAELALD